jgi:hypothetical protein
MQFVAPRRQSEVRHVARPTRREILDKWSHIAMRLFPPQMEIARAAGATSAANRRMYGTMAA